MPGIQTLPCWFPGLSASPNPSVPSTDDIFLLHFTATVNSIKDTPRRERNDDSQEVDDEDVRDGAGHGGPDRSRYTARLFRAHPPPVGCSRRQWRPRRLHRTCKEAGEARVDLLGSGLGTAETGACSATPAGEADAPTQSGSGCQIGHRPGWRLGRGPDRRSRVRVPGGAVLHCWDGGAALTASSGMDDGGHVTNVNHFYNGPMRLATSSPGTRTKWSPASGRTA